jgi:hypothetical protein
MTCMEEVAYSAVNTVMFSLLPMRRVRWQRSTTREMQKTKILTTITIIKNWQAGSRQGAHVLHDSCWSTFGSALASPCPIL